MGTVPFSISGSNIAGWINTTTGVLAFVYNGTSYTTIAPSMGGNPRAYGISGSNVVGSFFTTSYHGFLYNGSTFTTLDDPLGTNGTVATGIFGNDIVGYYSDSFGYRGFLYDGSTYTTLDDPLAGTGLGGTQAFGISASGIVGTYISDYGTDEGFFYNGSTYETLEDPHAVGFAGGNTYAYGISGNTVVGNFSGNNYQGFITTVPEPVSITLIPLAAFARLRRKQKPGNQTGVNQTGTQLVSRSIN